VDTGSGDAKVGVRRRGVPPVIGESLVFAGLCEEGPPPYVNPAKGKCAYPFDQLEVGYAFDVKRERGTVKGAVKRWRESHKSQRFQVWKVPSGERAGWIRVKRIK